MKKVLVTGAAGFIGYSLVKKILTKYIIIGIDNLNDYYDVKLKEDRLKELSHPNFTFIKGDISDKKFLDELFQKNKFDLVINLAAQAGVRYSIENPDVYITSNVIGFYNILECCRNNNIKKLIYASSSSVYGECDNVPFNENDKTDTPVSLYAATKKTDEILAYSYSKLYGINCTGLRFFTVYGPWGRPDMAYFKFTNMILKDEKIKLYNYGNCLRDFTYIDDITNGIIKVMKKPVTGIYNIGNSNPIKLMDFVTTLQKTLIKYKLLPTDYEIKYELLPLQEADVEKTYADTSKLEKDYNYKPSTNLEKGLDKFIKWYITYYKN